MTIAAGETITAADINAIKDDVDAITSATQATVATSETTTSTSYTNLSTSGPSVTITTGTSAIVIVTAFLDNTASHNFMSFEVSGSSSVSASDTFALRQSGTEHLRASAVHMVTGLTAGSNTFTAKYKVAGGTGTFANRSLLVIPLGD